MSKSVFSTIRALWGAAKCFSGLLFLVFCSTTVLAAQYIGHNLDGHTLIVQTDKGAVHFTPLSDAAVDVEFRALHAKRFDSYAIDPNVGTSAYSLEDSDNTLLFQGQSLQVRVTKAPFNVAFYGNQNLLLSHESGFFQYEGLRGIRFGLGEDEKLIAGGQRVLGMDRRGYRLPLYNKTHWGYTTESNQMYFGLPALLSSKGYGLIFDNAAKGAMDLGASESDVLQFEAIAGRNAYIVVAGLSDNKVDYSKLIQNFTAITGRQPMPPAWAFGNFASRFGYRSEQQVRDVVKKYQTLDIPLDSVVLDLYWFGPEMQGYMGNLDWDRANWPTAETMIQDFKEKGIQTVVITEPFILKSSSNWQSAVDYKALATDMSGKHPRVFDMFFGTAGLVDVFSEQGQNWFWQKYQNIFSDGVAGIWGDLGEPEVHPENTLHATGTANEVHNAYGHQWAKTLWDNHLKDYPEERLFLLMRSGFVGSQRYGMIPWTGDVSRSWGGLKPQVELTLQMGMLGLAYTHSDLGGFGGGDDSFDKEMYIRWLQYGVFQPIYRPHAFDSIPSEPIFHDKQTQDILRQWIKLRYQLFPYNYTLAYKNSTSGLPLMRPVLFAEPDNPDLFDEKNSYLWGDAFFVHPVTDPDVNRVNTRLPLGIWFDYWSKRVFKGQQALDVKVSLETLPLFVKAGSFIPYSQITEPLSLHRGDALDIHYFHHPEVAKAKGQLYEDDGKTRNSLANGQYQLTQFESEYDAGKLSISLIPEGNGFATLPETRTISFTIHNLDIAQVSNIKLVQEQKETQINAEAMGNNAITFSFSWQNQTSKLEIISSHKELQQ
ncbi:TIM-barrel domain-containing protein [Planctobacterium marinum]|uniref:glycoside hydrolase family 31 protein n=1 Tax=Planctobacterium marinum TaxID=1631968 RepID=UPI0030C6A45E